MLANAGNLYCCIEEEKDRAERVRNAEKARETDARIAAHQRQTMANDAVAGAQVRQAQAVARTVRAQLLQAQQDIEVGLLHVECS